MDVDRFMPRPWIVALHKLDALGDRRMTVEPEFYQWIGIACEIHLAQS